MALVKVEWENVMKKLKNLRIMYKIFLGVLAICVCFFTVIMIGSARSKARLRDEVTKNIDSRSLFWCSELNRQIDMICMEQSNLLGDSALQEINVLWQKMGRYEQISKMRNLSERLIQIKLIHDIVSDVTVYFFNQSISASTNRQWERSEDISGWPECVERIQIEEDAILLTGWFPFRLRQEDVRSGYCIQARLERQELENYLDAFLQGEEGMLLLLDPWGGVLAEAGVGSPEEREIRERMLARVREIMSEGGGEQIHLSGDHLATCIYNQSTGCRLLYIYPHLMVEQPLRFLLVFNLVVVALTLLFFFLFMLYAYRVFVEPVDKILNAMGNHARHFYIEEEKKDEFHYIYDQYNEMVSRINHLTREKLDAEYRIRLAQLRQLQYQIQPHFLYNSIFAISRMATLDENEEIAEFTKNLGQYYQYITKLNSDRVQVGDEIGYLKNYLYIQETRFGDRIRVEMDEAPGQVLSLPIMPLILQPLVENAWEHGVKEVLSDGLIRIGVSYEAEIFTFCVEDNGKGITDEEILRIWEDFERQEENVDTIHGLSNVYGRIRRAYGEEGTLRVERREEGGTRTVLQIRIGGEDVQSADY